MKQELLQWVVCPRDLGRFELIAIRRKKCEIESGALVCATFGTGYPVVRGVPRFVKSDDYALSFGLQWNRHAEVQLDSRNGTRFSRNRFYNDYGMAASSTRRLVLDVGYGAGRFSEIALSDLAELVAVDLSSAVDAAYKNLGTHPRFHRWPTIIPRPRRRQSLAGGVELYSHYLVRSGRK